MQEQGFHRSDNNLHGEYAKETRNLFVEPVLFKVVVWLMLTSSHNEHQLYWSIIASRWVEIALDSDKPRTLMLILSQS